MDTDILWKKFAIIMFGAHTLCIIELLDVMYFKKPYVTFFIFLVAALYYFNLKIYKFLIGKDLNSN
jgi:hypothetical protein